MNQEWVSNLLYKMAMETTEGVIVEHGTFHGAGTIQLCLGTMAGSDLPVYTIDDYVAKRGWIGEPYVPEDRRKFRANLKKSGVEAFHIQMDIDEAVVDWEANIGLWYYDLGARDRFWNDWTKWNKHILPGGHAIIKDTAHGDLGATEKMHLILGTGAWEREFFKDGVTVLEKR